MADSMFKLKIGPNLLVLDYRFLMFERQGHCLCKFWKWLTTMTDDNLKDAQRWPQKVPSLFKFVYFDSICACEGLPCVKSYFSDGIEKSPKCVFPGTLISQ